MRCCIAVVDKGEARAILEDESWALGQLTHEQLPDLSRSRFDSAVDGIRDSCPHFIQFAIDRREVFRGHMHHGASDELLCSSATLRLVGGCVASIAVP